MSAPPIQPVPLVMTVEEAAEILRCSTATVDNYIHDHQLVGIRIGRETRVRGEDLYEFISRKPSNTRTGAS